MMWQGDGKSWTLICRAFSFSVLIGWQVKFCPCPKIVPLHGNFIPHPNCGIPDQHIFEQKNDNVILRVSVCHPIDIWLIRTKAGGSLLLRTDNNDNNTDLVILGPVQPCCHCIYLSFYPIQFTKSGLSNHLIRLQLSFCQIKMIRE